MVRAVDDQRFTPFTRVLGGSAQFTKTVMHAVIHHTLFFSLNQECRRVIITNTRQNLFPACIPSRTQCQVGPPTRKRGSSA